MKKLIVLSVLSFLAINSFAQKHSTVRKKDRKRDVLLQTNYGDILIRLSDSTPLHRENFMIQSGDPESKHAAAGQPLGNGGPGYEIPAEFRELLFHKKGAIAAARM